MRVTLITSRASGTLHRIPSPCLDNRGCVRMELRPAWAPGGGYTQSRPPPLLAPHTQSAWLRDKSGSPATETVGMECSCSNHLTQPVCASRWPGLHYFMCTISSELQNNPRTHDLLLPSFTDQETEAQRSPALCPKTHSQEVSPGCTFTHKRKGKACRMDLPGKNVSCWTGVPQTFPPYAGL